MSGWCILCMKECSCYSAGVHFRKREGDHIYGSLVVDSVGPQFVVR